jgi:hypothetical protein|tara:strand:- start:631 stop:813 length:183 start_codon:yes stop_codon:yes gene_type:complete
MNVIQFKKKEDDTYKTNIYYRFGQAKALLKYILTNDSLTTIERTSIDKFISNEDNIKENT